LSLTFKELARIKTKQKGQKGWEAFELCPTDKRRVLEKAKPDFRYFPSYEKHMQVWCYRKKKRVKAFFVALELFVKDVPTFQIQTC